MIKQIKSIKSIVTLVLVLALFSCSNDDDSSDQGIIIPDATFKAYLLNNVDINTNGNSEISINEAKAYSGSIIIDNMSISDLTGIEEFINITRLDCQSNNLSFLDVSNNLELYRLHCAGNSLKSLDISVNTKISEILCYNNQLTSLNIANGNNDNFVYMKSYGNYSLSCIQIDNGFNKPTINVPQYSVGWTKRLTNSDNASYSYDCNR